MRDVELLAAAGMLRIDDYAYGGEVLGCIMPNALTQVNRDFGLQRRDRVLLAIYELAGKKVGGTCNSFQVIELAEQGRDEVFAIGSVLADEKLIDVHWNPEPPGSYTFMLQWRGIETVEGEAKPMAGMTFNAPVAYVNQGHHEGTANVSQTNHSDPAELLRIVTEQTEKLIAALRDVLPADKVAVIELIRDELRDGKKLEPKSLMERVKSTGKAVIDAIDFGFDQIEKIPKRLEALTTLTGCLYALSKWVQSLPLQ